MQNQDIDTIQDWLKRANPKQSVAKNDRALTPQEFATKLAKEADREMKINHVKIGFNPTHKKGQA